MKIAGIITAVTHFHEKKKSENILGKKASITADDKPRHSFTMIGNTIQLQFSAG